jgi:hypothetical protein
MVIDESSRKHFVFPILMRNLEYLEKRYRNTFRWCSIRHRDLARMAKGFFYGRVARPMVLASVPNQMVRVV